MKLNGRRESSNVDDRRGKASGIAGIGGLGIGGIIIYLLFTWMSGGDMSQAVQSVAEQQMGNVTTQSNNGREFTAEEQELAKFSSQILAGTEDVWTEVFRGMGKRPTSRLPPSSRWAPSLSPATSSIWITTATESSTSTTRSPSAIRPFRSWFTASPRVLFTRTSDST